MYVFINLKELRKKLEQWCNSNLVADPVAMQRHVSELQQRDIMNISRVKELETKLVYESILRCPTK